jgi:hypothetical protein
MPAAVARLRLRTGPGMGMVKQRSGCFSRILEGIPSVSLPKTRQLFLWYGASQKLCSARAEK